MAEQEFDVVVIGGGPAGENVADRAAPRRPHRRHRRAAAGRRRVLVLGLHAEQGAAAARRGARRGPAAPRRAGGRDRARSTPARCSPGGTTSTSRWRRRRCSRLARQRPDRRCCAGMAGSPGERLVAGHRHRRRHDDGPGAARGGGGDRHPAGAAADPRAGARRGRGRAATATTTATVAAPAGRPRRRRGRLRDGAGVAGARRREVTILERGPGLLGRLPSRSPGSWSPTALRADGRGRSALGTAVTGVERRAGGSVDARRSTTAARSPATSCWSPPGAGRRPTTSASRRSGWSRAATCRPTTRCG